LSTKTLLRLLCPLLAVPVITACSGDGVDAVAASQPTVAASASAQSTAELSDALVALGKPIVVHTMGIDVPLVYTVTLSNLRTRVASGNTIMPTRGQFIMVDVNIHADTGRFVTGSPGMFHLVLADGTVLGANLGAAPDRVLPGVSTVWVQSVEQGQSFGAQLLFDAPLKLTGCKIEVVEISGVKGGWTLA